MSAHEDAGLMWTEKYRPSSVDGIVDQEEVKKSLVNLLKEKASMPHLLFHGPAGSGKTSTALIVSKKVLGEYTSTYTLSLNASDERKLEDVRNKVKIFARTMTPPGIPYKLVILDEADEMHHLAQPALRRIMEDFSRITRFVLICNYLSGIIPPIQSRCAIFHFQRLPQKPAVQHLKFICEKEGLEPRKEALELLFSLTGGDLRRAINTLQTCAAYGELTLENVKRALGVGTEAKVKTIIEKALEGDFEAARLEMIELIRVNGIPEKDFMREAYNAAFSEGRKKDGAHIAEILARYDSRVGSSNTPEIQLSAMLAELSLLAST